ncbi:MAG: glycosyl hydrolase family 18 protein [Phaeodactylibacter sp.]|uniref:glycosyl hydrolase family 18 protein n=1 Tax=Phaeodactylibacter sp. TaxID=1940289 RepID=UPI0032ED0639
MKRILLLLTFAIAMGPLTAQQDFKVIGYLPYYRFSYNSQIEYERLTHLNLSFANPDMEGNLDIGGQDITPIVSAAKAAGVDVYISLAGGALTDEWEQAWEHLMLPQNRSAFIHKIMQYVEVHELDGIDFDLEWSHVNEKYSPFVLELRDSVTAHGLTLTAALPGTHRYPDITDEALAAYDWINMMAYDLTGSWAPNNPGPHSPYSFALNAMFYWQGQGVPKSKLTLGVPFYGYDFGGTPVVSRRYGTIVDWDPENAWVDQVDQVYYNGIPTIVQKTQLAHAQLAGIMIWELGQDHFSDLSLLRAIDETLNITSVDGPETTVRLLDFFPNPFRETLTVANTSVKAVDYRISDVHGRILRQARLEGSANTQLDVWDLPKGFYLLTAQNDDGQHTYKLIKP